MGHETYEFPLGPIVPFAVHIVGSVMLADLSVLTTYTEEHVSQLDARGGSPQHGVIGALPAQVSEADAVPKFVLAAVYWLTMS